MMSLGGHRTMKISRRSFIAAAPAVVTLVSQMDILASARAVSSRDPLSKMTSATFLPYVGTEFVFSDAGTAVSLRLDEVEIRTPANYVATRRGEECFALHFSSGIGETMVGDTFAVEHFALHGFLLFITQGGIDGDRRRFTAVFNRLVR